MQNIKKDMENNLNFDISNIPHMFEKFYYIDDLEINEYTIVKIEYFYSNGIQYLEYTVTKTEHIKNEYYSSYDIKFEQIDDSNNINLFRTNFSNDDCIFYNLEDAQMKCVELLDVYIKNKQTELENNQKNIEDLKNRQINLKKRYEESK